MTWLVEQTARPARRNLLPTVRPRSTPRRTSRPSFTRVQPSAPACAPPFTELGVIASKSTPSLGVIGPRDSRSSQISEARTGFEPAYDGFANVIVSIRGRAAECELGRLSEILAVESSATFGHVRARRALHPALHPGGSGYTQPRDRQRGHRSRTREPAPALRALLPGAHEYACERTWFRSLQHEPYRRGSRRTRGRSRRASPCLRPPRAEREPRRCAIERDRSGDQRAASLADDHEGDPFSSGIVEALDRAADGAREIAALASRRGGVLLDARRFEEFRDHRRHALGIFLDAGHAIEQPASRTASRQSVTPMQNAKPSQDLFCEMQMVAATGARHPQDRQCKKVGHEMCCSSAREVSSHERGLVRRATHSAMRTELACARALLDALESMLEAADEEACRDVVEQATNELARVTAAMKKCAASQNEGAPNLTIENAS